MKNITKLIIIFILFVCSININAQNIIHYNLYPQNNYLYNPATTGENPWLTAFVNSHLQWVGFEGAPRVNTFGIHSPITKKMGIGLNILNSKHSIFNYLNAKLSYSYKLNFAKDNFLRFGISAGVINNSVAFSNAVNYDLSDTKQINSDYNLTGFAASAGLFYKFKNLEIHASLPQLYELDETSLYVISSVGYDLLAQKPVWDLKPSVMIKASETGTAQFDINLTAMWNKTFWANLAYRTNKSFIVGFGINYKNIGLGYAFELNPAPMNKMANGTHEIQLIVNFGKNFFKNRILKEDIIIAKKDTTKIKVTEIENNNKVVKSDTTKSNGNSNKTNIVKTTAKDSIQKQKKIERERVIKSTAILGNLEFETGTSKLTPKSYATLDGLIKTLKENSSAKIEIAGHSDNIGSKEINKRISKNRAKICTDYIISKGIPANRVKAIGYGKSKSLVSNNSRTNRAKNRRVEFKIID